MSRPRLQLSEIQKKEDLPVVSSFQEGASRSWETRKRLDVLKQAGNGFNLAIIHSIFVYVMLFIERKNFTIDDFLKWRKANRVKIAAATPPTAAAPKQVRINIIRIDPSKLPPKNNFSYGGSTGSRRA